MSTSIERTDATWNPVVGCSRVSKGCENCYAERVAHRAMQPAHEGLTAMGRKGPRWNGTVRLLADRLEQPLRWRKPRRVFVNSMSDLFHEGLSFDEIAAVFGVMAACPQHTFQVLTKRPERAAEFFEWAEEHGAGYDMLRNGMPNGLLTCAWEAHSGDAWGDTEPPADLVPSMSPERATFGCTWPLPNVWLGVSVEDQATADERIPHLLRCPAAVRWVSYEPALGPVDFASWIPPNRDCGYCGASVPSSADCCDDWGSTSVAPLSWIVVGGESGPGARPFDLAWARSTIEQCRAASVPVFVKQLGRWPTERAADLRGEGYAGRDLLDMMRRPRPPQMDGWTRVTTSDGCWYERPLRLRDRKGGDPSEWPEDLRVREYPEVGL